MKTCAICSGTNEPSAETCAFCGEASWLEPAPSPAAPAPTESTESTPAPKAPAKGGKDKAKS